MMKEATKIAIIQLYSLEDDDTHIPIKLCAPDIIEFVAFFYAFYNPLQKLTNLTIISTVLFLYIHNI